MEAKIYEVSETLNALVNVEKLDLEIRAASVGGDLYLDPCYMFKGNIYVEFSAVLEASEVTRLDDIIAQHDGEPASTTQVKVDAREQKIRDVTEMALYHPALDDDDTVEYLTSIDNWFNGWKRSGRSSALVSKIALDAASGVHPQNDFLQEIVNAEGNKCYEFLISKILE